MMKAIFAPFGILLRNHPWLCMLGCAALALLSAYEHWGHALATFTCAASMILMWEDERRHPAPLETPPAA
ncbi:hypothetical protein [Pseudoroseomonas cervicalis]|uniref:hypothetical protein n=1 Tax=Teichococcus cervicalis TaxID=204525 RepID=UPI0022F19955|nr:hypothetical protein [Pseudoroseomonas cervicalis]WBV45434.1 hypothetical protein PFY06_20620 [Pseudoroseomonas cervicalis]